VSALKEKRDEIANEDKALNDRYFWIYKPCNTISICHHEVQINLVRIQKLYHRN